MKNSGFFIPNLPKDIQACRFTDGKYFESKEVKIEEGIKHFFLEPSIPEFYLI